jgi:adenosylhomocysteine nucleosidase
MSAAVPVVRHITGVMTALAQEAGDLIARLQHTTRTTIAKREYMHGYLGDPALPDTQALVVCIARVGKVAAASTATTLIQHFGVQRLLFVGLAGGIDEHHSVRVGDCVVATELAQHDFDSYPFFPHFVIPMLDIIRMPTDQAWSDAVFAAADAACQASNASAHRGLIISGDQFINGAAHIQQLLKHWPDALAVEMEGAAVAQVCFEHDLPLAVVRTISDRGDEQAHGDFSEFLAAVAAPRASTLLRSLFP